MCSLYQIWSYGVTLTWFQFTVANQWSYDSEAWFVLKLLNFVYFQLCDCANTGTVRDHAHSQPHIDAQQLANAADNVGDDMRKLTLSQSQVLAVVMKATYK